MPKIPINPQPVASPAVLDRRRKVCSAKNVKKNMVFQNHGRATGYMPQIVVDGQLCNTVPSAVSWYPVSCNLIAIAEKLHILIRSTISPNIQPLFGGVFCF